MKHDRQISLRVRGSALLLAIVLLAVMSLGAGVTWRRLTSNAERQFRAELSERAWQIAEAGLDKAVSELRAGRNAYHGEENRPFDRGSFSVKVEPAPPHGYTVRVTGMVHDGTVVFAERRLAALIELSQAGRIVQYRIWEEQP